MKKTLSDFLSKDENKVFIVDDSDINDISNRLNEDSFYEKVIDELKLKGLTKKQIDSFKTEDFIEVKMLKKIIEIISLEFIQEDYKKLIYLTFAIGMNTESIIDACINKMIDNCIDLNKPTPSVNNSIDDLLSEIEKRRDTEKQSNNIPTQNKTNVRIIGMNGEDIPEEIKNLISNLMGINSENTTSTVQIGEFNYDIKDNLLIHLKVDESFNVMDVVTPSQWQQIMNKIIQDNLENFNEIINKRVFCDTNGLFEIKPEYDLSSKKCTNAVVESIL